MSIHYSYSPFSIVLLLSYLTLTLGYVALFKHYNDDLTLCCYVIPGNPKVTNDGLAYWHDYIQKNDPSVSRALGKNAKMERMKAGQSSHSSIHFMSDRFVLSFTSPASLRFGGEKLTYGEHILIVGDAAGQYISLPCTFFSPTLLSYFSVTLSHSLLLN